MKALVKERPEPGLALKEIAVPRIAHPNDVLFEVKTCAICTGETKVYEWGAWAASDTTIHLPTVLGHEAAGVVREVGADVTTFKSGDRIVVDPIIGCGWCAHCRSDRANMCPDREIYGKRRGAFAEYAVLSERSLCHVPGDMGDEEAAMLENFGIAVHAVEGFAHAPGDLSVVMGAGPIGIMAAQVLIAWGQRVVIADLIPSRLETARTLVDGTVVDASRDNIREVVARLSHGRGADFVLEAAGSAPALDQALDVVKNCGTVVTIGTFDADVSFNPFFRMTRREISLVSRMGRTWATWQRMTRLLASGRFDFRPFVSHILPLQDYVRGFQLAKSRDVMKVVLKP